MTTISEEVSASTARHERSRINLDKSRDTVDKNNRFTGWYYDDQQRIFETGRLTSVSLHSNAVYKTKRHPNGLFYSDWDHHTPDPNDKDAAKHYPWGRVARDGECAKLSDNLTIDPDGGYFLEPLCTSVLNEDFNLSIANSWSSMGEDALGGMWNGMKQYAPYASGIADALGGILIDTAESFISSKEKMTKEELDKSPFTKLGITVASAVKTIGQFATDTGNQDIINDYLNRSLVMQGTRFSYYQGTGINFGNLSMKFTIFPKWKKVGGEMKFFTVPAQIKELYPYFVGEYIDEPLMDVIKDGLGEYVGWQCPPGGFRAAIKDVDNVQKGTLKLKIGSLYSVSNLVVENCQLNFSKECVKCPDPGFYIADSGEGVVSGKSNKNILDLISPLYCEVTLTLHPVTKYSSQTLRNFFNGTNMMTSKLSTELKMTNILKKGVSDMKDRYSTKQSRVLDNEFMSMDVDKRISTLVKVPSSTPPGVMTKEQQEAMDKEVEDYIKENRLNNSPTVTEAAEDAEEAKKMEAMSSAKKSFLESKDGQDSEKYIKNISLVTDENGNYSKDENGDYIAKVFVGDKTIESSIAEGDTYESSNLTPDTGGELKNAISLSGPSENDSTVDRADSSTSSTDTVNTFISPEAAKTPEGSVELLRNEGIVTGNSEILLNGLGSSATLTNN